MNTLNLYNDTAVSETHGICIYACIYHVQTNSLLTGSEYIPVDHLQVHQSLDLLHDDANRFTHWIYGRLSANNNSAGWLIKQLSSFIYRFISFSESLFWARLKSDINKNCCRVSVSTSFAQSRLVSVLTSIKFPSFCESKSRHPRNFLVSVSTSKKFLSLDEFRSWHPRNFKVSMGLGLDIYKTSKSLSVIKPRKAKQKESNQITR